MKEHINKKNISSQERKEIREKFASWYMDFMSKWNYSALESIGINEKLNILKSIINLDEKWEQEMKRMEVSFKESKKKLELKIKNYKTIQ